LPRSGDQGDKENHVSDTHVADPIVEAAAVTTDTAERGRRHAAIRLLRAAEIDLRMLGMLAALAVIWILFNILSDGTFLTPRNLWNLSVQTTVVAIMATGMVLVIVTRNIDLSVGSMLGVVGMAIALLQNEILSDWLGIGHWAIWIIAVAVGIALGAVIGALQGVIVAYGGVPSFIVTLGGLLVWRGVAWRLSSGRTIAPMDSSFQRLGGGATGSIGGAASWLVAILACVGIVAMILNGRRQRRRFRFPLRPMWAELALGSVGCLAVLGGIFVLNRYAKPPNLADGATDVAFGLAIPVLILVGVALAMTFFTTRTKFGRYVFAIGGNPEAAELGGINTRLMVVRTFMLMGILVGIAAVVQTARLNAATSGLGTLAELYVIAAAVIGGTSFSGGIGTIPGAVLGALVMQSLISGMVLMRVDAPIQDIVVGIVLVVAVALDTIYRRRVAR
jgi:D-xylose transport system permease protein